MSPTSNFPISGPTRQNLTGPQLASQADELRLPSFPLCLWMDWGCRCVRSVEGVLDVLRVNLTSRIDLFIRLFIPC